MRKRKITLIQSDTMVTRPKDFKPYLVTELRGTVEYSIGERLDKAEVERLIVRPGFEVVVRGERV